MGLNASKSRDGYSEEMEADVDLLRPRFPKTSGSTVNILSPDGLQTRTIGYAEYGDLSAPPNRVLLFMHGTPGTRFFFTASNALYAERHQVRIVVPERPGFGLSTPVPNRTLLSFASDAAAVLDALGVSSAHVVGYSAGGPYALAFASEYMSRCSSVVVVSGLSPNVPGVTADMTLLSKVGYFLSGKAPKVLKFLLSAMSGQAVREAFASKRDEFTDVENDQYKQDKNLRRCFAESTLELYSRDSGVAAEAEDYVLMARDWGFDLESLKDVKVFLYGGGEDNKCTPAMFRELERGLANANLTTKFIEAENHLYFYRLFENIPSPGIDSRELALFLVLEYSSLDSSSGEYEEWKGYGFPGNLTDTSTKSVAINFHGHGLSRKWKPHDVSARIV